MSDVKLDEAKNIATPPERLIELVGISTELARAVAANPNAPSKLLEKLSKFDDLEIRQNVTLNPNTATNILFKLGKDFPQELLNNPILTLLLLENPNFIENIPTDTFIELLLVANVPQVFMDWALQAPTSAQNIKTPLSTLKYIVLCSKKYETVCPEAIKALQAIKQRYPEKLTNFLVEYVEKLQFPSAARLFLLLHATAPSDFLSRHYRSLDWRERYAVAQNPNTPLNILEKLRFDANCIVRAAAKARF